MSLIPQLPPLAESLFVRAVQLENALGTARTLFDEKNVEAVALQSQLGATRKELADRDDVIGFLESENAKLHEEVAALRDDLTARTSAHNCDLDTMLALRVRIDALEGQLELQGHDDAE